MRFASRRSAIQDLNIALAACLPGEEVGTMSEVDMGEEGGSPPPLAALRWRGSMSLFVVLGLPGNAVDVVARYVE